MTAPILEVQQLKKKFGSVQASNGISLTIRQNELHAVIGPNGAGKTTLIAQLSGELSPDSGNIYFKKQDITFMPVDQRVRLGIARSYQITSIFEELSVLENVSLAVQGQQGHSFRFWKNAKKQKSRIAPAQQALEQVGLQDKGQRNASEISHGEKRQLEIAMTLATKPSLLLLDEPMAGMGPEESQRMIDLLKTLKKSHSILLIEHDMEAVFSLADHLTVLDYGKLLVSDKPDVVRNSSEVKDAYFGEGE